MASTRSETVLVRLGDLRPRADSRLRHRVLGDGVTFPVAFRIHL